MHKHGQIFSKMNYDKRKRVTETNSGKLESTMTDNLMWSVFIYLLLSVLYSQAQEESAHIKSMHSVFSQ